MKRNIKPGGCPAELGGLEPGLSWFAFGRGSRREPKASVMHVIIQRFFVKCRSGMHSTGKLSTNCCTVCSANSPASLDDIRLLIPSPIVDVDVCVGVSCAVAAVSRRVRDIVIRSVPAPRELAAGGSMTG